MTKEEIIKMVSEECAKAGFYYLIQIDDGQEMSGKYNVKTNSKLHNMAKECNKLSDSYNELTYEIH